MRGAGKVVIIILFFVFVGAIVFWNLIQETLDREYSSFLNGTEWKKKEIVQGIVFRQDFIAEYNYLHRIGISAVNFHPDFGGIFIIRLLQDGEAVAQIGWETEKMYAPRYYPLEFPPLLDSKGKRFTLELEASVPPDKPLTIFTVQDHQEGFELSIGDRRYLDERVDFYAAYENPDAAPLGFSGLPLLIKRISQYKPVFLKGYPLIVLSVFYILLAFLFFIVYVRKYF